MIATASGTMPVTEFCQRLGINADSFRQGMREATKRNRPFFIGYAYFTGKSWVYVIPRKPAEYFLEHGRLPDDQIIIDA